MPHTYTRAEVPADLARLALAVQDACNLCGVLHSAAEAAARLQEPFFCRDTDWLNGHPVMVLFADKIASLTGLVQSSMQGGLMDAYDLCHEVTE